MQALLNDPRWSALAQRRNVDFHRWRPQSIQGGVSPSSPWVDLEDDRHVLAVCDNNVYTPEPASTLLAESAEALESLAQTMERWINLYPSGMEQVLTFVLASRYGEDL